MKEYQNPDVLRKLYWEGGLSLNQIAKKFGVNSTLILHHMKRQDIKRDSPYGRKLDTDKETLENLYWKEKLSLGKIAKIFSVNPGTILYNMKRFGIPREKRKPIQLPKVSFAKEMLEDFYWKQRLNQNEIANKFGVSSTVVSKYMKRFGVPRRPNNEEKIIIPKALLKQLYLNKHFSSLRIGEALGFDSRFIRKRLNKFNIPMRTLSETSTKHPKTSFSENLLEKSYMLGLRTGDVHAKQMRNIIRAQSTTTHPAFIEMMKNVFGKYSYVGVYKFFNKGFNSWEWFVYSDLNKSFDFLLDKLNEIPGCIRNEENLFYSFLAGYADAEGCWRIAKSHEKFVRFVFKIDSMDKLVLEQIKVTLEKFGIKVNFYLKQKKGTVRKNNGKEFKYNNDFYSLVVYRKSDVISLANKLLPLSRHPEKISMIKLLIENHYNNSWDKIESNFRELRNHIKESRLK